MTAHDWAHVEGPEVGEYTADVTVTFFLTIDALEFDVGNEREQLREYLRTEVMAVLVNRINEALPGAVVDHEYEVTGLFSAAGEVA